MSVTDLQISCPQGESTRLLLSDSTRLGFSFHNRGPGSVHIDLSGGAALSGIGIPLREDEIYSLQGEEGSTQATDNWPFTGQVHCYPVGDGSGAGGVGPTGDCLVEIVDYS